MYHKTFETEIEVSVAKEGGWGKKDGKIEMTAEFEERSKGFTRNKSGHTTEGR